MLRRVETFGYAAVYPFADCGLQFRKAAFVLLQQPQPGPDNLAGIVVTPLGDLRLDEILEITAEGYRCRLHTSYFFCKVTNI